MSKRNPEPEGEFQAEVPASMAEVGTRIGVLLQAVGGLEEARKITGVSTDALANWRAGRSRPAFLPLAELCRVAGMSLDWLATGRGAERRQERVEALTLAPLRLSKFTNLWRLSEAYEDALEHTKNAPATDNYRLMEITLALYDAMTSVAEIMAKAQPPPPTSE